MPGASASIVVNAPLKVVYDVVLDFEKYSEFLPDVKKASVEKKGKTIIADFEISVLRRIHYTLSVTAVPSKKISWTLVKSDFFKDNKGHWEFKEAGKGKTQATYTADVDFGFMVPSIITKKLVGSSLPSMLKRFKERAEKLV
jgi:ribosome-associated toxin RatA of RatAB toxin-antitoxin module